eukprot:jgi/Tetstr1/460478/TSEL_005737.t1
MIARSIATALASSNVDRVTVSTDDAEIADVARAAGAEVPFMRPADLSDDMTGTLPVLVDALERIEAESAERVDALLCLYATAPFVRPDLEPAYHDAGQFYWCRPEALRAGRPLLGPTAAIYPVDRARAQDIDTPDDWAFAEKLFRLLQQDEGS